MHRWFPVLIVLIFVVHAASLAAGDPETGSSEQAPQSDRGTSWHSHPYTAAVPVLLEAGHIQPAGGLVVLGARDDVWWHTMNHLLFQQQVIGGIICQVPPGADPCPPLPPESAPGNLAFCHGISLHDGDNWHSGLDTYVWVGGFDQLGQSPGQNWCEHARPATTGVVTHWPAH